MTDYLAKRAAAEALAAAAEAAGDADASRAASHLLEALRRYNMATLQRREALGWRPLSEEERDEVWAARAAGRPVPEELAERWERDLEEFDRTLKGSETDS